LVLAGYLVPADTTLVTPAVNLELLIFDSVPWQINVWSQPGLPDLLFAKGPKNGQPFFQIYQQLQSHMNLT